MATNQKTVMNRIFEEVFNQHNLDLIPEFYCEDCSGLDPANDRSISGHEALRNLLENYRLAFPDHRYTIHALIEEDDMVCVHWTVENLIGTDGYPFQIDGLSLCQLLDGKVRKVWQHWDNLKFLKHRESVPAYVGVARAVQSIV